MISVVVSLYNKERYIRKCIDSILNQTNKDFEVVVVDDGSTDDSLQIVRSIQDERLRVIERLNGGPAAARNTGINNARGEWIIFLDADDLFLPYALDYFTKLIREHLNFSYIICNYFIYQAGRVSLFSSRRFEGEVCKPFYFELCGYLTDRIGSAIYKKDVLLEYPFNEKLRRYEDAESQYNILNHYRVYQSWIPVMISNRDASEAAGWRKDINEDYLGHLVFKGISFWQKIMHYRYLVEAKNGYPDDVKTLYPRQLKHYQVFIFLKGIALKNKIEKKFYRKNNPLCSKMFSIYQLQNTYQHNELFE